MNDVIKSTISIGNKGPEADMGDYISELISMGYSSLARDNGAGNLDIYKNLDTGLEFLNNNVTLVSEDITKCVVLLKLLIDLRENIISSEEVPAYKIPNIHKSADSLNELLIKSAQNTIQDENQDLITNQCEAFLKAADEIRNEQKIRGLGILDSRLKNVIGRLRKKSDIKSVFNSAENEFFENYKTEVETIMQEGSLKEIGQKLLEMKNITQRKSDAFAQINRLLKYMKRYENRFFSKIKNQMNSLNKKNHGASLYNIQENMEELSDLISLEVYHKKKGLTLAIKRLVKNIQKLKVDPLESALNKMIDALEKKYSEHDWADYVILYDKKYKETEIFSDSFYAYTLKGLTPNEAIGILQEKRNRLKSIELDRIIHINYEKEFEILLDKLIQVFKNQPGQK